MKLKSGKSISAQLYLLEKYDILKNDQYQTIPMLLLIYRAHLYGTLKKMFYCDLFEYLHANKAYHMHYLFIAFINVYLLRSREPLSSRDLKTNYENVMLCTSFKTSRIKK